MDYPRTYAESQTTAISSKEAAARQRDADYLMKPLIEDTVFVINDEMVKITNPSTCHAMVVRCKTAAWPLPLYTEVLRSAKAKGVKIGYSNHYRKLFNENWELYQASCAEAELLYKKIKEQAAVVQSRGLHYGCVDDLELSKLHELCHAREKFFYRDQIISKMKGAINQLLNLKDAMARTDCSVYHIYL